MGTVDPIRNKKDLQRMTEVIGRTGKREFCRNRNKIIWLLGITSGLRVSDIVALNVSDVKGKHDITILEKKTKKHKKFPINKRLIPLLKQYINAYCTDLDEPLFKGYQGKRIDRREVFRFLESACDELGIEANIGTHTMRKTFGYHHYQQFKDAVLLQKIFNHSSLSITLRYIGVEQEEIDKSYKNFDIMKSIDINAKTQDMIESSFVSQYNKLKNSYERLKKEYQARPQIQKTIVKKVIEKERATAIEKKIVQNLMNYIESGGRHSEFCKMFFAVED